MQDIGILASTDPLAIYQAAIDLVYAMPDSASLVEHIGSRKGLHTLDAAEAVGAGQSHLQSGDHRMMEWDAARRSSCGTA